MANSVLVDTSVFIEFFRRGGTTSGALAKLLEDQHVVLSPYVRMELLMGVRKEERRTLADLLSAIPVVRVSPKLFETAEELMPLVRKRGISCGLIDYLICLQALELQVSLLTLDRVMGATAKAIGVDLS